MVSGYPQSTAYSTAENGNDLASSSGFTIQDFFPECLDRGGLFGSLVYETFGTLIKRANEWLRENRKWKITTCESFKFKAKGGTELSKMTYLKRGELPTWYIRGLRLWLTERKNDSEREQQIGIFNLIPQQVGLNGVLSSSMYEILDQVMSRLNSMLQSNPCPGRVIAVESRQMKISNVKGVDPDRCIWQENADKRRNYLFVIRVFYDLMDGCPEEIGIKDFAPDRESQGGCFSHPKYELFSNVVDKASDWCRRQRGLRLCNVQSLEVKRKTSKVDTQRMDYIEHGERGTRYLRILRVCYAKPSANVNLQLEIPPSVSQLTCKTFVPVQLTKPYFKATLPKYETLKETKDRVTAWVRATGAHVVSVETVALRAMSGGERKHGTEASFTFNQAGINEHWIFVIRLYLDGVYREPPPEMLPPVPDIKIQRCCVIL